MLAHLPALQVVIPLLAAPLAVLVWRGLPAWIIAWLSSLACTVIAALLLAQVWDGEVIRYYMGAWPPPWGIEYRIDLLNALILLLVSGIGTVTLLFAYLSVAREVAADRQGLFYGAFLLCFTGLLGITITGDAFNVYVFLEISSLATYALVSLGRDRRALTAAYQYLIMGTIGATFILIGVGFMYVATGTLNMVDLFERLPQASAQRTVQIGFTFFTVGVGLKLALFPLHLWLPNAYTYAPSVVSAFLAATATKVAIYVMVRFFLTIFGPQYSYDAMPLTPVLMALAVMGMVSGSLVAIFQTNAKRLLAYSSVAQIGYIVLGISLGTVSGVATGLLHLWNHAMIKGALFLALGCVVYRLGADALHDLRGLAKQMPWTMTALLIGGMSLIGVPLTAGFTSKLRLVRGALEIGYWPLAVLILGTSLLALIYVWRLVEPAFFQAPPPGRKPPREAPLALLVPTWILALANVYFGIDTRLPWTAAQRGIALLFGGGG